MKSQNNIKRFPAVLLLLATFVLALPMAMPVFAAEFEGTVTITGDLDITVGETTTLTATWSTNKDITRGEWTVAGVPQGEMTIDDPYKLSGSTTIDFYGAAVGDYIISFHIWHHTQGRDVTESVTVHVTAPAYYFAYWRPPISLDSPPHEWNAGSTKPVKFIVVDGSGNEVTDGVVAEVQIGSSEKVNAVWELNTDEDGNPVSYEWPAGSAQWWTGQWKAEISVVGPEGSQNVTIDGNVSGVPTKTVLVK